MKLIPITLLFTMLLSQVSFSNTEHLPMKILSPPTTVSKQLQPLVSGNPIAFWQDHPQTNAEWNDWITTIAEQTLRGLPALREKMQVTVTSNQLGGVNSFLVIPKVIAPENQKRILLHFHGGGYVLNPGESGTEEAIMMAGYGKIAVISIDYRMAPDFPFPAAMDDALAAYKALLTKCPAENIGLIGTSTGGGMTLALMISAKEQGLPLPGAIVAGTPWTDLTKTGDSYFTHEGIDNVLVSYDGWLGDAAKLYANGHDLTMPLLSPIYGDVTNLPPILLFSGTRDLFLSNTVRMHLKLRDADVNANLIVFEGLSHAQYLMVPDAPETKRYFMESQYFFDQYLAK